MIVCSVGCTESGRANRRPGVIGCDREMLLIGVVLRLEGVKRRGREEAVGGGPVGVQMSNVQCPNVQGQDSAQGVDPSRAHLSSKAGQVTGYNRNYADLQLCIGSLSFVRSFALSL